MARTRPQRSPLPENATRGPGVPLPEHHLLYVLPYTNPLSPHHHLHHLHHHPNPSAHEQTPPGYNSGPEHANIHCSLHSLHQIYQVPPPWHPTPPSPPPPPPPVLQYPREVRPHPDCLYPHAFLGPAATNVSMDDNVSEDVDFELEDTAIGHIRSQKRRNSECYPSRKSASGSGTRRPSFPGPTLPSGVGVDRTSKSRDQRLYNPTRVKSAKAKGVSSNVKSATAQPASSSGVTLRPSVSLPLSGGVALGCPSKLARASVTGSTSNPGASASAPPRHIASAFYTFPTQIQQEGLDAKERGEPGSSTWSETGEVEEGEIQDSNMEVEK